MNISSIINDITPLHNNYKEKKFILNGKESIILMWDIGLILEKFIIKEKIAPHTLYREIYGKSEGTKNITQKSYITREFLSRCYRIKNIFPNKNDIFLAFPNLRKFNLFREAMPFFDNKKYILKGKEREDLLNILNSNLSNSKIMRIIKKLQKDKISISNSRKQKLKDLEEDKKLFIKFYNYIYYLLKYSSYSLIKKELKVNKIEINYLSILIKNTISIAKAGLKNYSFEISEDITGAWLNYSQMIKKLITKRDERERRRFRRVVPPDRILRLSDYMYLLLSENNFKRFKKKAKLIK